MDIYECPKCGRCHVGVDEQYVQNWEKEWQVFWPTLSEEKRENYGCKDAPPTRDAYLKCFGCGNTERDKFFISKKNLYGNTLTSILIDDKK